jgi:hypothetical protein
MKMISIERARGAQAKAIEMLSRRAGILGIGLSRVGGDYVVKVNLRSAPKAELPKQIDGVRLIYEQVGNASVY